MEGAEGLALHLPHSRTQMKREVSQAKSGLHCTLALNVSMEKDTQHFCSRFLDQHRYHGHNYSMCPIRIRDAWYTALVSLNNREKKGGKRLILIMLSGSSYLRRRFHLRRNT